MRMHRHHLLEIILWPNSDGTFSKILNSKKRLRELGIYDDWKLTITIPADEHIRMHSHNRTDEYWNKVSQAISIALSGEKNAMYGKKHSAEAKRKMSKAKIGHSVSDATKRKISAANKANSNVKGTRWYNNGITNIRAIECPIGFTLGRICKRKEE